MSKIVNNTSVTTEALQVFSAEEAQYYRLLPYGFDASGAVLCYGEEGRDYAASVKEIRLLFGKEVKVWGVPAEDLSKLLLTHYRPAETVIQGHLPEDTSEMISFLIEDAHAMRASDIHMEPLEQKCRIRYRVDGRLLERHVIPLGAYTALVNRVKILSSLDISEKRLPQDGRILFTSRSGGGTRLW